MTVSDIGPDIADSHAGHRAYETPRKSPGRLWPTFVATALGAGIIIWMLTIVGLTPLFAAFREANYIWLLVAIALGLAATVLRAKRFELFFPHHLGFPRIYGIFALARPLNVILPFRSGELLMLFLLKRYRAVPSVTESIPVWAVIKTSDVLALVALLAILFAFVSGIFEHYASYLWIGMGLAILACVLGVVAMWGVRSWSPADPNSRVGQLVRALQDGGMRLRSSRRLGACLILALAIATLLVGAQSLAQVAFVTELPFAGIVAVAVTGLVASLLPFHAPMGIGTGDLVWVGTMTVFGMPLEQGVAIALSMRVVVIITIVLDGIIGAAILARVTTVPTTGLSSNQST